jgi:2,5-diketo-D-gluconate reductase A
LRFSPTVKLANSNHAPEDLRRSFDTTFQRLGVEHLDLFLIHWTLPTVGEMKMTSPSAQ